MIQAYQALDRAVDTACGEWCFATDIERVAFRIEYSAGPVGVSRLRG